MEYKKILGSDKPHQMTFSGEEIDVLRASYTEYIAYKEQQGQAEEIAEWQKQIALTPHGTESLVWNTTSLAVFSGELAAFAERTEHEIRVIIGLPIPNFEKSAVVKRRRYGETALKLALEMNKFHSLPPISEQEIGLMASGLDQVDLDQIGEVGKK